MIPKLPAKRIAYTVSAIVANQPGLEYYDVAELEVWHAKVFEGAVEVYGYQTCSHLDNQPIHRRFFQDSNAYMNLPPNTTALVILERPIKEETAETLLKRCYDCLVRGFNFNEPYLDAKDLMNSLKTYFENKKD